MTWNQNDPYNSNCPKNPATNLMYSAGCAAVVQAQIMNYWEYPSRGQGRNTYNWKGTQLSASFDHFYNWPLMNEGQLHNIRRFQ